MLYVTGNEIGEVLTAELTFNNGQVGKATINSGTPAEVEALVHEYQNNDLIKSFKIVDGAGKVVVQG